MVEGKLTRVDRMNKFSSATSCAISRSDIVSDGQGFTQDQINPNQGY